MLLVVNNHSLSYNIQAKANLQIKTGGLVFEIVMQTTAVVEVVLHARLSIET